MGSNPKARTEVGVNTRKVVSRHNKVTKITEKHKQLIRRIIKRHDDFRLILSCYDGSNQDDYDWVKRIAADMTTQPGQEHGERTSEPDKTFSPKTYSNEEDESCDSPGSGENVGGLKIESGFQVY